MLMSHFHKAALICQGEGEPMSTGGTEKQDLLTHNCIPILSFTQYVCLAEL